MKFNLTIPTRPHLRKFFVKLLALPKGEAYQVRKHDPIGRHLLQVLQSPRTAEEAAQAEGERTVNFKVLLDRNHAYRSGKVLTPKAAADFNAFWADMFDQFLYVHCQSYKDACTIQDAVELFMVEYDLTEDDIGRDQLLNKYWRMRKRMQTT